MWVFHPEKPGSQTPLSLLARIPLPSCYMDLEAGLCIGASWGRAECRGGTAGRTFPAPPGLQILLPVEGLGPVRH